jgi:hypothetical protein
LCNSKKTPTFAHKIRKRKEKHGKKALSQNGYLHQKAPLWHFREKEENSIEDVKKDAELPATSNFMAFLQKNVVNYLQDLGFMPIFAAKLRLCVREAKEKCEKEKRVLDFKQLKFFY